jgi:chromosome segregation ATPase
MAAVARGESIDYDFEDLLDSFEKKFAKKLAQRAPPAEASDAKQFLKPAAKLVLDPSDYHEELSLLLFQVHEIATLNRQHRSDGGQNSERWDESIWREVLRTEIRSTMAKLKMLDDYADDSGAATSAQKTTMASLKRRNRELSDELDQLRKHKKSLDIKMRSIAEMHETYQSKLKMVEERALLLQTERGEQDSKLRELESSTYHLTADKKRLEKSVAMLRTELLTSHHKVSEEKLKTTQAERRIADLESRAVELRDSESALAERVAELNDVQGKMLEEMKKVVESRDAPAARRALTNLNQQRSRIVGKIASLLTKRNGGVDRADSEPSDGLGVDSVIDASVQGRESSMLNNDAGQDQSLSSGFESSGLPHVSPNTLERHSSSDGGALQKKSSFMHLFRIGSQTPMFGRQRSNERSTLVPSPLSKSNRQQIYEANLIRSRESAERDSDVLRDVVENKKSEIERLELELKDSKEQAAAFERELHSERQNRRKENRNLHVVSEDEPRKQMTSIVQQRNKPSTLFEWQGSASRLGSVERDSPCQNAGA